MRKTSALVSISLLTICLLAACNNGNLSSNLESSSMYSSKSSSTLIEKPTDFELPYKDGFKILNLTDIQIIDSAQCRTTDRLDASSKDNYKIDRIDHHAFYYIDELVKKTNPDLITLNGDNVYGEFDDKGTSLKLLIEKLETYEIPYTLTFGNHDNESKIGLNAQIDIINAGKHALFKDKLNFIGLYGEDGKLKRNIVMFDSNGCGNPSSQSVKDGVSMTARPTPTQRTLIKEFKEKCFDYAKEEVPSIVYQHIIALDVYEGLINSGELKDPFEEYVTTKQDWFGALYEKPCCGDRYVIPLYQSLNADNVMYGHDHTNNLSFILDDIRYTYVVKSSTYDYHRNDMLGGTLSVISNDGKDVKTEHIFIEARIK